MGLLLDFKILSRVSSFTCRTTLVMAEGRVDRGIYPSNICPHALCVSLYIIQDKAADGKETGRQSSGKQFGCRLVPKTGGRECLLATGSQCARQRYQDRSLLNEPGPRWQVIKEDCGYIRAQIAKTSSSAQTRNSQLCGEICSRNQIGSTLSGKAIMISAGRVQGRWKDGWWEISKSQQLSQQQ